MSRGGIGLMPGGKQKPLETIAWTAALVAANLYSVPSALPDTERPLVEASTEVNVAPSQLGAEILLPRGLPGITIETTTTIQTTQQFAPDSLPSDVVEAAPAIEASSALENQVRGSLDAQQLDDAKLAVVDIVPSPAEAQSIESTARSSRASFVLLFLTRGDGCATAFAATEGEHNDHGQLMVSPMFAGKLPEVAIPNFYNGPAMFKGRDIIQAETGENLWRGSIDNTNNLASATQALCNAYLNNIQVAETQLEANTSSSD